MYSPEEEKKSERNEAYLLRTQRRSKFSEASSINVGEYPGN